MRTRRVLFVAEAVTLAHVGRTHALAQSLDRSRFTPVFAWDPRYNALLGELGGEYFPLQSVSSEHFIASLRTNRAVYDLPTLEAYVAAEGELFAAARPDVVVGDFRLSLPTSTQLAGLPFINLINAHWSPYARPRFTVPQSPVVDLLGVPLAQLAFDLARPLFFLQYAHAFNRLNHRFGRPGFGSDLRRIYCYGDRVLYPDLAEIVTTEGLPETHRYLGPVVWSPELPIPAGIGARDAQHKTVYVNMGTSGSSELVPAIVAALLARKLRVIAALGNSTVALPRTPGLFVCNYISGEAACAAADLVIFNGGSTGGHQALLAGVPVVGLPLNLDQFLNMDFIEKAGLGLSLRGDRVTAKRIGEAADRIFADPRYAERARAMAGLARRYAPGQVLAQAIDEVC